MKIFWLLVILLALFGELVCYSALAVASREDEREFNALLDQYTDEELSEILFTELEKRVVPISRADEWEERREDDISD